MGSPWVRWRKGRSWRSGAGRGGRIRGTPPHQDPRRLQPPCHLRLATAPDRRYRARRDVVQPRCTQPSLDPPARLGLPGARGVFRHHLRARTRIAVRRPQAASDCHRGMAKRRVGRRPGERRIRGDAQPCARDHMASWCSRRRGAATECTVERATSRIDWQPGFTDVGCCAPTRLDLLRRVESGSLAAIVRTFKAATAKRINNIRLTPGAPVWQRNYYERVIRDDRELKHAREYILDNPNRWAEDRYNPANAGERPA